MHDYHLKYITNNTKPKIHVLSFINVAVNFQGGVLPIISIQVYLFVVQRNTKIGNRVTHVSDYIQANNTKSNFPKPQNLTASSAYFEQIVVVPSNIQFYECVRLLLSVLILDYFT